MELRSMRERAGLTQRELARRARVDPRTLRRYERGEREPTVGIAARLRQACAVRTRRQA